MSEIWQQIKQLRSTEYRLVKNILEIWRDIKRLREEQTYLCTNVKVAIQRSVPLLYIINNMVLYIYIVSPTNQALNGNFFF